MPTDAIVISDKRIVPFTEYQAPSMIPNHLLKYNQYIILIDEEQGVFQSNVYQQDNSWSKLANIPEELPVGEWASCINPKTNKLYIFIIQPWNIGTASVAIYDIARNEWSHNPEACEKSIQCLDFEGPMSIEFVADKLHILDTTIGSHYIYDENTQSFNTITNNLPFITEWDNMVYIPSCSTFFIFGYNHDAIYCADTTLRDGIFNWKQLDIKLPAKELNVTLVFGKIVMLWSNGCGTKNKSIWFLDVEHRMLYHSPYILHGFNVDTLVECEDGYLHGMTELNSKHIKINLYEIIPAQLINFYIERIERLIAGFFISQKIRMPKDIINLLRLFVPPIL